MRYQNKNENENKNKNKKIQTIITKLSFFHELFRYLIFLTFIKADDFSWLIN